MVTCEFDCCLNNRNSDNGLVLSVGGNEHHQCRYSDVIREELKGLNYNPVGTSRKPSKSGSDHQTPTRAISIQIGWFPDNDILVIPIVTQVTWKFDQCSS